MKLFRNFDAYDGAVQLVTLTAPGAEVLPWDRSHCQHPDHVNCSGKLGCQLERPRVRTWNRRAPKRWSAMNRACAQRVRRRMPRQLHLLGYAWEYQRRGALHLHLVLGVGTPAAMHAAASYVQLLHESAGHYGFGFVDRKMSSRPGQAAAAYLAAYFIDGEGAKASIRETVTADDVPALVVYVSRLLTNETGVTMRTLRLRRIAWHRLRAGTWSFCESGIFDVDTGELVLAMSVVLRT